MKKPKDQLSNDFAKKPQPKRYATKNPQEPIKRSKVDALLSYIGFVSVLIVLSFMMRFALRNLVPNLDEGIGYGATTAVLVGLAMLYQSRKVS